MAEEQQKSSTKDQWARGIAVFALLLPLVQWTIDRYWPSERIFRPDLITHSTEVMYEDSRFLALTITNNGNKAAEEVTAIIETYRPGFTFDEAIHKGHTHIIPPSNATITVQRKRIIVKLGAPIGENQRAGIIIDRIPITGNVPPMFHVSATSKQGRSEVDHAFDYRTDRHSTEDFGPQVKEDFVGKKTRVANSP